MELSDFVSFGLMAVVLGAPFGSIYFVIRRARLGISGPTFFDAFLTWLTWATSNLLIYLAFIVMDTYTRLFSTIPQFGYVALAVGFVGSTLTVALLLRYLFGRNSEPETSILRDGDVPDSKKPPFIRIAFSATLIASLTFAGILAATNALYNYYYPPNPNYGIYDISSLEYRESLRHAHHHSKAVE